MPGYCYEKFTYGHALPAGSQFDDLSACFRDGAVWSLSEQYWRSALLRRGVFPLVAARYVYVPSCEFQPSLFQHVRRVDVRSDDRERVGGAAFLDLLPCLRSGGCLGAGGGLGVDAR